MSRNNTGNPIDSKAFPDFEDNVKNLDLAVNSQEDSWEDRFRVERMTLSSMERAFTDAQGQRSAEFESAQDSREERFNDFIASSGYQFLGDYGPGIEFTEYNQLVRDENGEFWRLSGQIELPYTTTGSGIPEDDALVPAGDAVLRQDLANPAKGAAMVARGVVAVDSIADLLALPEGQRKEGLRYLVKGYHAGSDLGGGEFYYDASRVGENDHGTVLNGFVRLTDGLTATTYWFGLPWKSEGVDNTAKLQALFNQPRFALPAGFESSTSTLRPKSGTHGFLGDAVLKLMPGALNLTPVISFEDQADGTPASNIVYIAGTIDGNRGAESGTGPGGQDGGLHCVRVYSAVNVKWYAPRLVNAATDGLYINERWSESKRVEGFHMDTPLMDNNSRQGMSIVSCKKASFHDFTAKNTNGKLPQAGIDIEPNNAGENVVVQFTGTTRLTGNSGRGMMLHAIAGTTVVVKGEDFEVFGNGTDSLRMTQGGSKSVTVRSWNADRKMSIGGEGRAEFKACSVDVSSFEIGQALSSQSDIEVEIGTLKCVLNAADTAFKLSDSEGFRKVRIDEAIIKQLSSSGSALIASINGTGAILDIHLKSPEAPNRTSGNLIQLSGELDNSRISVLIDKPLPLENIRIIGNGLHLTGKKTVADGRAFVRCDGDRNVIDAAWHNSDAPTFRGYSGTKNIVTVNTVESNSSVVLLASGVSGNIFRGVMESSVDPVPVGRTLNTFVGCVPLSLNTSA